MTTLKSSCFIKIKKVESLLQDQEACGINSIITLIKTYNPGTGITVEDLKEIFNFDQEGISRELYRFNRCNQLLAKNKCPVKIYQSSFVSTMNLF